MSEVEEERKFQFLRDGDAEPSELDWNKGIESARKAISEAMNAKNIAFLLGAGCSSLMKDKKELGIATMAPLAKEFCGETIEARAAGFYSDRPTAGAVPAPWRLTKDELDYLDALGVDLAKDYSRNLERLMEVLFAQRFVLRQSENPDLHPYRAVLDGIIKKVQDFLWTRVTKGAFATEGDTTVRDLYERFYKKLVLRDRSLPRPWVFTTNYDHFSELAMDRLGIPYANGFSGVEKSYAIQAGRDLRIIVDSQKVRDEDTILLSRDIAKAVEEQLSYPGQIRITVIRETRSVEYAK